MSTIFDLIKPSAELKLNGPDGTELPVKLRVQGMATQAVKRKAIEVGAFYTQATRIEQSDKLAKAIIDAERMQVDLTATAVVGWDNDEFMGGPYTPEYAKQLLSRPEMNFVVTQVSMFLQNESNFFQGEPAVAASVSDLDD